MEGTREGNTSQNIHKRPKIDDTAFVVSRKEIKGKSAGPQHRKRERHRWHGISSHPPSKLYIYSIACYIYQNCEFNLNNYLSDIVNLRINFDIKIAMMNPTGGRGGET